MIGTDDIGAILEEYDQLKLRIGMTASHSALDICDGAIEEGFPTVAYCQKGREKTYSEYFKTERTTSGRVTRGMVDKAIVLDSFNDVLAPDFQQQMRERNVVYIPNRSFTSYSLDGARIERYVIGPVFNLNFFYSPLEEELPKLELLGVDWRFESSLDGHVRLPAPQQMTMPVHQQIPEMTVVGHNTATIRESLLEKAFELGEKFIRASKEHYDPGIIGPFCLQTCIDKDMDYYIYDVAPRVGGGTNVHVSVGHPYGNATWRKPMSSGRRIAMEIRRAVEQDRLDEVVT